MSAIATVLRTLAALVLPGFVACSLVANPDSLQEGCPETAKPCTLASGELGCVDRDDPGYGCASNTCVPCTLPAAEETCSADGDCAVATCASGRGNCNTDALDGCETNLEQDYDNCATCGHSCADELRSMSRTVSARCRSFRCQVDECEPGFADCDGAAGNGCEVELSPEDCGRCDGCPSDSSCNTETGDCE